MPNQTFVLTSSDPPAIPPSFTDELAKSDLIILAPVFNDWEAAVQLAREIDLHITPKYGVALIFVDDGSTQIPDWIDARRLSVATFMVTLRTNLGHQRAIAVGLGLIAGHVQASTRVVVMDSDGEDRPADILPLVDASDGSSSSVVVANRADRSEGTTFRLGYWLYKKIFRILTGTEIRHGNFSVLSAGAARRVAYCPTLWNHYAATLEKARLPIKGVDVSRGIRYSGQSSMNLSQLIVHGLSAMSVNIEVVAVRMLTFSLIVTVTACLSGLAVIAIRLFSDLAVPGWASVVGIALLVLAFQAVFMSTNLVFNVLAARDRRAVIPAQDCWRFVETVKQLSGRGA